MNGDDSSRIVSNRPEGEVDIDMYAGIWHNHAIKPVLEKESHKILWDFNIQTVHKLEHNRPDIVVIEKKSRKAWIYDDACTFDTRVIQKENEKVEKYQDLKREMARLWKLKSVVIVPVVIGAS